jgi:hypothetical protein
MSNMGRRSGGVFRPCRRTRARRLGLSLGLFKWAFGPRTPMKNWAIELWRTHSCGPLVRAAFTLSRNPPPGR